MNLGGLVPFTLSDYPGKIAAVVFTQGCNFRCPFCHNGGLIPWESRPDERLSEHQVLRFLQSRIGQLEGVVVSGGEPTLQPDLKRFLSRAKTLGYAVKLDTNGSRPEVLRRLFNEGLLDYVAMDVKAPWDHYERLAGVRVETAAIRASIGLIAQSGIPHEFRTTVVPQLLSEGDLRDIARLLPTGSAYRHQPFRSAYAMASHLRGDEPHSQPAAICPAAREDALHGH